MDALYAYYNKIVYEYADPRSVDYFMLGSPLPVILVLTAYWLFIKKIGPAMMKDRPPYDVKWIMQIYNLTQVAICGFIFCRSFYFFIVNEIANEEIRLLCLTHNTHSEYHLTTVFYSWLYYMLKILDLMDTVFFVLRKKFNQVTTLHTYHHTIMFFGTYAVAHYYPSGACSMMGMINCLVHAFMYFYYFYCAYNVSASKSIWWKKYITILQMSQFCFYLVWFTPQLFLTDCEYPKSVIFAVVSQSIVMLQMFGSYYYNAFIKPKNE